MNNLYTRTPFMIVMYSTEYCPDCLQAKNFFEANDISYLRVLLEEDPKAVDFVMQINHGYRSVPTIIFPDGSILVEPSLAELQTKFSST